MSKSRDLERLDYIAEKIIIIFEICETQGGVTRALEDFKMARAAILMHFTAIAEQFSKLRTPELCERYAQEIQGAISVRNFVAHDYEGVNLTIIEQTIREILPVLLEKIQKEGTK